MIRGAVIAEGALLLVALGVGRLTGHSPLSQIRVDPSGVGWGLAATLPLCLGLAWCLRTSFPPIVRLIRLVNQQVRPLFEGCSFPELVLVSALAGAGEEALFRGVLQPSLADHVPGWMALITTAAAFGLVHFLTREYAIAAGIVGLYLGAAVLLSGNLFVPMLAHGLYDLVALVLLVRVKPGPLRSVV
ncbi:MAG: CPBP family intramembrane glutamic endopeptidase [Gemmatimonadales bacterium]